MARPTLQHRRILIVEDEYTLADDLRQELEAAGADVIGPCPNVTTALEMLEQTSTIDGAILDINLSGEPSFPVADELASRRIPFLFTTGYDSHALPERYQAVVRCEKPIAVESVCLTLTRIIAT